MVSVIEGVPVKFEWVGLVVADRELNCAGSGRTLAPIILQGWAS
jgi:hypothetical protein